MTCPCAGPCRFPISHGRPTVRTIDDHMNRSKWSSHVDTAWQHPRWINKKLDPTPEPAA